eukprot:TRINITY_DN107108_c0_g1_i1.p1 TRINITY_DN107108_c0_g1~~TRINITY_DN107108_c0_g1_i1.p1  ORF type:complete len:419 (-),score=95.17 TRINITY_DN107108_c0_g1_i1:22-1278(-)
MASRTEQLYKKVLARYPDCPTLPALPKSAACWNEADFEVFVASMGCIIPPGSGPEEEPEETSDQGCHALFECAPRRRCSSGVSSEHEETQRLHILNKGTADACLVMSSSVYMVDRAAEGLKVESILTKFDQCRAAALQGISGMSTSSLVEQHGVGILLSDIYYAVQAGTLPAVTAPVTVESEIDLPKMPMLPSRQSLVGPDGEKVCSAVFGQLFVDMKTTMLSQNSDAYNRVKRPCDEEFGRSVPNSATLAVRQQLAAKWAQDHPKQGRVFTPSKYLPGRYVVAPSDCDTYNTLYHPKVASVCEHACLSTGEIFCCAPTTAFFCRFISTLPPGTRLNVHVFVAEGKGTRALYVFEKDGSCALCAFAVYDGPVPGFLYHEEVQAVTQKNAEALLAWAKGSVSKHGAPNCDLSKLKGQAV